jgi:glycosyltransferase involved in cell wall biosynthesis
VTVEPPVQDPAALDSLYAWADVLVLPSRFEGLPLAILEAQRLGCVVLATAVGAVPEAVTDGVTGLLVSGAQEDDGVVADCAAALRRLADDPALLLRLGMAGAAQARAGGWARNAAPWLAALDRLCPPEDAAWRAAAAGP